MLLGRPNAILFAGMVVGVLVAGCSGPAEQSAAPRATPAPDPAAAAAQSTTKPGRARSDGSGVAL